MVEACSIGGTSSTEIDGQARPAAKSPDKFVRRKFGAAAKLAWKKPDATIAHIAECDARTGRRILSGRADVPLEVALALMHELIRPLSPDE